MSMNLVSIPIIAQTTSSKGVSLLALPGQLSAGVQESLGALATPSAKSRALGEANTFQAIMAASLLASPIQQKLDVPQDSLPAQSSSLPVQTRPDLVADRLIGSIPTPIQSVAPGTKTSETDAVTMKLASDNPVSFVSASPIALTPANQKTGSERSGTESANLGPLLQGHEPIQAKLNVESAAGKYGSVDLRPIHQNDNVVSLTPQQPSQALKIVSDSLPASTPVVHSTGTTPLPIGPHVIPASASSVKPKGAPSNSAHEPEIEQPDETFTAVPQVTTAESKSPSQVKERNDVDLEVDLPRNPALKKIETTKLEQAKEVSKSAVSPPDSPSVTQALNNFPSVKSQDPSSLAGAVVHQIDSAIVGRAHWVQQGGQTEFQIRLNPPDLGSVKVHMTLADQSIQARLVVHQAGTQQLIESQMESLKQSLAQAGITLSGLQVSTNSQGHSQAWQHQASSRFTQDEQATNGKAGSSPDVRIVNSMNSALVDVIV
jgi:flagellar hook-length control protein FliK